MAYYRVNPWYYNRRRRIMDLDRTLNRTMMDGTLDKTLDRTLTPVVAAAAGQAYMQIGRGGRGVPEINKAYTKKCSCNRDKTLVFCRSCGYYCNGRIRLPCAVHPRVTFLLDIAECPRCHSPGFLDEHHS